jgi:ubiquinone/menaquinone biosynthesis C-methylase UbiE
MGTVNHSTRVTVRNFLRGFGKRISLIDLGCGPCIEYEGYKVNSIEVDYTGVDSSKILLQRARDRNPEIRVINSDLQTSFSNESFDVVLIRHILEHQKDFTCVIKEAVRLSKKYVIVVTFREGEKTIINPTNRVRRIISKEPIFDNTIGSKDLRDCLEVNHLSLKQKFACEGNTVYITEKRQ